MITVVVGPPCAGKSTWISKNAAPGDVVVDFDALAKALGSGVDHRPGGAVRDVAFAVRDAAIDAALQADVPSWIIHTSPGPDRVERYAAAGAAFRLIDPGMDVCLERMGADGRPPETEATIRAWYESPPTLPDQGAPKSASLDADPMPGGGRMHIKTLPARVKAGPADGLAEGEFLVYPSTFIREPDSYGDVVAKGAFAKTIERWKASGNVLPGLYGHRLDDPDFFVASALDMGEDEHGWWVKGAFDLESPKGPQVYRLAKGRRLNQLSFAYDVVDEAKVDLGDGRKVNELRELDVYEFSFVPVGANQDTSVVAVKALADSIKAGRVLSSKNESALRDARDAIDSVLASLGDDEPGKAAPAGGTIQEQASGHTEAKNEEPSGVKFEEPRVNPSARALAELHLLTLA